MYNVQNKHTKKNKLKSS